MIDVAVAVASADHKIDSVVETVNIGIAVQMAVDIAVRRMAVLGVHSLDFVDSIDFDYFRPMLGHKRLGHRLRLTYALDFHMGSKCLSSMRNLNFGLH